MKPTFSLGLVALAISISGLAAVERGVDARSGLPSWHWSGKGLDVTLIQRTPDQTRAFYLARGFPREAADRVATSCIMQTIIRNVANHGPVDLRLEQWVRIHDGDRASLKLRREWGQEWQAMKIPLAPRIAFDWSLFPPEQHFEPGDWNMGMTSYRLPPGSHFDLMITWRNRQGPQRARLDGIQCAPEQEDTP